MTAIERIEAQQAKLKAKNNVYWLGEQLKDICREDAHTAELVAQDLENPDMDIVHMEKKIKAYADAHKSGNQACVPPQEADRIIREFYGLPARSASIPPTAIPASKDDGVLSIFDLI